MNENTPLEVNSLLADSRISTAKKLILEAIAETQNHITGIRPPRQALEKGYHEVLSEYETYRGSPLFFPYLGSGIGRGPFVELLDGSIKYDFIGGIGVHYFGHSHPALIEASLDAALSDIAIQGNLQQNGETVELARLLTSASKLPHCFISNSGAMATENALKIAFQKNFPAQRIFAFDHCFAGRTLALSQTTDKPAFRQGLPPTLVVDYVPFFDPLDPEKSTARAVEKVKSQIVRYPKGHASMLFEVVQGEAGFYPGTHAFFSALMELLKENGIAIIVDEVQSFGRTPELFAFHHFGLQQYVDICTIGKLSQVCATLFTDEYNPKPGLLSQTFIASTSSIRCGITILKSLLHSDLYGENGKIHRFHTLFVEKLSQIAKNYPGKISGPFGIGAMIAFTPFEGKAALTAKMVREIFKEGLICFTAGSHPTRIRMLPPVPILSEADVIAAMNIIETVIARTPHESA